MAFRSDRAAKRTWDPETGWELFEVPRHPGMFELRHPTNAPIQFWREIVSVEKIEEGGVTRWLQNVRVKRVNERTGDRATPMERQLIEAALLAYGVVHNGPTGPINATYVG